jgi:UDP-glucose:(heptosyl)LPS alpha-1,3-glucosyltransferase
MRIGIVTTELDPARGGMGQWCSQFVHALAYRGYELHVVAERFGAKPLPWNVARHRIDLNKSRSAFSAAAEKQLRELNLDVVHDMGAGWRSDLFQPHGGSHVAFLARRMAMYPRWLRALKRPIDSLLSRHRDCLRHCCRQFKISADRDIIYIALSQTVADDFVRLHQIRPERIAIVYNGVDCQKYSPVHRATYRESVRREIGVNDETMLLLLAAHNFRLKGVPELMRVTARLVDNRYAVHAVVVGGKRLAKWRRRAMRSRLTSRITFIGAVSDLIPYYAAADAYVHPTYYDPCSLVILEAAASGLPIVTTRRYNGAAELFREDSEILTVTNPYDSDALYERVAALFDDRLRTKLGAAARDVASRHPFRRNVEEILRLYEQSTSRRSAA